MKNGFINIFIFGTGLGAEQVLEIIDLKKASLLGYLDNDVNKQGGYYNSIEIINPQKVSNYNFDYILIASKSFHQEMIEQLVSLGVTKSKIVNILMENNKNKSSKQLIKETYVNNEIYKNIVKTDYLNQFLKDYSICSMYLGGKERNIKLYNYPDYLLKGIDYVRLSTLELISREISERKIDGVVAELGVYRGDMTKIINDLFPDRKLYLFDTFEGFNEQDVYVEQENSFSKAKPGHLSNTNIETVLSKIPNRDNVIVREGYFPNTTVGLKEEVYAFVSIDVDLYKPTYEGLCYFYQRLAKGGYMLIHDYNFDTYKGVKNAIRDFSEKFGVNYVPVSDYFGSVIFSK